MNASVATNKFKSLLRDILANTTIKLGKVLSKFIYNCVVAIVSIRGRVNFLQLKRHSSLNEKTFRDNFSKDVDWIGIVWSNALKRKVRVVIVAWGKGNRVVYFSTNAISDTEFALRILEYAVPDGINERVLNKIDHMIASYLGAVT